MTDTAQSVSDVIIIGAGPTGLAAAIYTAREDLTTLILEKGVVGGMAAITDQIDNYPGFAAGISGLDLAESLEKQAKRFGAEIKTGIEVTALSKSGDRLSVETSEGTFLAKSVLLATGSAYRKLDIPGEAEFTGRGVHYCATCDGAFYRGKHVVVVGGGNSAIQESLFLTKFADKITMLVRGPALKGTQILVDEIMAEPKIEIHYSVTTTAIEGAAGKVAAVSAVGGVGSEALRFACDGVFVFVGLIPNTGWLKGSIELDEVGFVLTSQTFGTNLAGVFAAGDVRSGATWQIASAVGEGVSASLKLREYLRKLAKR